MEKRRQVALACEVCGARNYRANRPLRPDTKTLELKKFCATCAHHTVHKETK